MKEGMEGKVVIVTGASRGIGAAVARGFGRTGAAVVLAARDGEALENLADEIGKAGGRAIAVPTDVSDATQVEAMVDRTLVEFGRLDVACNNAAGGGHPPTLLADVDVAAFDAAYGVILRGVFACMKYEIRAMTEGGAIVNVSSTAGVEAVGGLAAYVAMKHGVEGLTRVAALDYAARGVRVTCVAPGPILTERLARAGQAAQRAVAAAMPLGRVGEVEDVVDAVLWLASATYVTGTTLVVDGGKLAGSRAFGAPRGA
jgi:NAD(P)-dependent dehydrogenase (short-subunit alcohol dehydrogenase family)